MVNGGDALFDRRVGIDAGVALERAQLIARANKRMEIDAFVPGEHDLVFGIEAFLRIAAKVGLPIIAANLRHRDGRPPFPGYVVRSFGGLRVVIIGLVDPERWPASSGLVAVEPLSGALEAISLVVRPGDVVVVATALDLERAVALAERLPRADAVLAADGNAYSFFPREVAPAVSTGSRRPAIPVVSAGRQGQHLIQMDIVGWPGGVGLMGGALYDEAREERDRARAVLARDPKNARATEIVRVASATLKKLEGHSHYLFRFVDLEVSLAEDPVTARWRQALPLSPGPLVPVK